MVTDPISDFINTIKNAGSSGKENVSVSYSNLKFDVATLLEKEGYLKNVSKRGKKIKKFIEATIVYKNNKPALTGAKRLSKPSRRVYKRVSDIKPVRQGHGLLVLSTPEGLLGGREARKKKLGGEALFEIW